MNRENLRLYTQPHLVPLNTHYYSESFYIFPTGFPPLSVSDLEHLERLCGEVATGLDLLTFEEQQLLLGLVVGRSIVTGNSVRVETVIPAGKQHAGLLRTCHPELDSGSFSTETPK